jgi:hypothetical protein
MRVNVAYVTAPAVSASSTSMVSKFSIGSGLDTTTDSHGHYQASGLIDGSYIISTRNEEWVVPFSTYFGNTVELSKATLVTVKGGEVRSDLDIQINVNNLHHVRGVLVTADHQPVAKSSVRLTFADDADDKEERLATTAEDGSFVFPSVPDGSFVLRLGASKLKIAVTPILVSGQDITDLVLTAKP